MKLGLLIRYFRVAEVWTLEFINTACSQGSQYKLYVSHSTNHNISHGKYTNFLKLNPTSICVFVKYTKDNKCNVYKWIMNF